MIPETAVKQSDDGPVRDGEGWYVLNARETTWRQRESLARWCNLEAQPYFEHAGFQLVVMQPGEPACMYHGEGDQEDFLVVSGECVLIIEGQERRLKAWDFVHCPPMAEHVFVGAGDGPCVVVMTGSRMPDAEIVYPVNETAAKHRASVEQETRTPAEAYAPFARHGTLPYREGDLPGS